MFMPWPLALYERNPAAMQGGGPAFCSLLFVHFVVVRVQSVVPGGLIDVAGGATANHNSEPQQQWPRHSESRCRATRHPVRFDPLPPNKGDAHVAEAASVALRWPSVFMPCSCRGQLPVRSSTQLECHGGRPAAEDQLPRRRSAGNSRRELPWPVDHA